MRVHNFKYRKVHKVKVGSNVRDFKRLGLLHGLYGMRSLESYRVTGAQLESARRAIKKVIKKNAVLWIRVEADRPVTAKPAEVRMGKGKGSYSHSVSIIKIGTVLFELSGAKLTEKLALEAFLQGGKRLPMKTEFCTYKN